MSTTLDIFCGSKFWDNQLTWNTTNPDFTVCFQRTVLVWVPVIFLWIFAPWEAYKQIKSKNRNIAWNGLNIAKLVFCFLLIISASSELVYSIHRHTNSVDVPSVDYNTPFVLIVSYLLVALLIVSGKRRGIRKSGPLFIFWSLTMICSIFTYRSHILKAINGDEDHDTVFFATTLVSFPFIIIQFFLHCFADSRPLYSEQGDDVNNVCPEESSSFLSELLFWWMTPTMILGFRKPLEQEDLWKLNMRDRTENVVPTFDKHWERQKAKFIVSTQLKKVKYSTKAASVEFKGQKKNEKSASVLIAMMKAFWPMFAVGSFFKLFSDILQFANPQILRLLIEFTKSDDPQWKGLLFACALFVLAELQSLLLNQYFIRMYVVGIHVRSSLISALYRKALTLSNEERKESTVGEIVNLMSIDTQRFVDIMPFVNMIWSGPLQISLALYFLWDLLGVSVLAGVAVLIIMLPVNGGIGSITRKLQIKNMKLKDERTKLMNEVLNGIRVLKLYAWEIPFLRAILDLRNKEIKVLKKAAYLGAGVSFIWTCAPFLVSLASFATFVLMDKNNVLDAKTAFVALSLFNLLRFPINVLPSLIAMLIQVSVSVKRLNKFMRAEELDSAAVTHDQVETDPIIIERGTFSWGGPEDPNVLHEIDLKVSPNSLVAVVGQVGSGKSSLISAILGELVKREGRVNVKGSVAYVPQQAWIQNATLKDNILMYKPLKNEYYDKVVEACALKPDLDILPGGDQTEIGEKGINLSGGQKQRISLARAVYYDSDIYLLDDPLSAVDAHVGKHIFENVIGPKSILSSKTRVLVTHGISFLPQCDVVVVIKDGRISEVGSYKELLSRKGAFSEFIVQYISDATDDIDDEEIEQLDEIMAQVPVSSDIQRQFSRQFSKTDSESSTTGPYSPKHSILSGDSTGRLRRRSSTRSSTQEIDKVKMKPKIPDKNKLVQAEKVEKSSVKIGVYLTYMKQIGVIMSLLVLIFWTISQSCAVGSDLWLGYWSVNNDKSANDTAFRDKMLGVYASFGVGQAITVLIGSFCLAYGTMRAAVNIHEKMLYSVLRSPMSFFDTTPTGRIVNRFSKDVNVMDVVIQMNVLGWLMCTLAVISTLIVISVQTPLFLVIVIPIAILYYFASKFYIATSRQLKRLESVSRSPIYVHFSETITGASSIRAYGVQDVFIQESNNKVDTNQVAYYPAIIANRWLAVTLEFIGNCIILFAALFAVLGKDQLNPGMVGLSLTYAISVTATLNWMVRITSELETNLVSVERILEYSALESEAEWNIEQTTPNSSWPNEGQVTFDSYKTRYREGLDLVLKGIDCQINPGERIGICGRTGAGKSSLTLGLFRIIEASNGSIHIDGIDISKLGLHELRSKLTIIPQDPVLFSGTLRHNLDPFSAYSDDKVWTVLEHSHLKSFVKGFDDGLQHKVVEGGENLSVGQRQLVCLARALLRKTKILVLDEATAAVDLETDDLIQETIRKEFADCTILTIAHRLNTIMDSTRIIVLDKGRIKEFDTPSVLIEDSKSIFHGMAKEFGLI